MPTLTHTLSHTAQLCVTFWAAHKSPIKFLRQFSVELQQQQQYEEQQQQVFFFYLHCKLTRAHTHWHTHTHTHKGCDTPCCMADANSKSLLAFTWAKHVKFHFNPRNDPSGLYISGECVRVIQVCVCVPIWLVKLISVAAALCLPDSVSYLWFHWHTHTPIHTLLQLNKIFMLRFRFQLATLSLATKCL